MDLLTPCTTPNPSLPPSSSLRSSSPLTGNCDSLPVGVLVFGTTPSVYTLRCPRHPRWDISRKQLRLCHSHYKYLSPLSGYHYSRPDKAFRGLQTSWPHFLPPPPGIPGSHPTQSLTILCIGGAILCIFSCARDVLSAWMSPISEPGEFPLIFPPTPCSRFHALPCGFNISG